MILPVVSSVHKSRHGQPCQNNCGTFIPKAGFMVRLKGGTGDGLFICRDCSTQFPWDPDIAEQRKVLFRNFVPEIPNTLDLEAEVPEGFKRAIRLGGDYIQWAYWLGHYHGKRPE